MVRFSILLLLLVFTPASGADFMLGADVSFLPQVELGGGVFRQDGVPQEFFSILKSHGLNTIRLRLWHSPADGHSGLAETLAQAERAKGMGFDILLDFHYSDTWADPAHQTKPSAWSSLCMNALADSITAYTRDVLMAFNYRGVSPTMVQLGNEITQGMLWNEGLVGGPFDTPRQWSQLATLLTAATEGVHAAFPVGPTPEIMIHLDSGGNNDACRWYFNHLVDEDVAFDIIGLSYYPWWHGSLDDLENNLNDLAVRYGKDLVVVETAYPWTLGWFDDTHNLVGLQEHLLSGYDASPQGQRLFLERLHEMMVAVPSDRGRGVFWWAPEWVAAPAFGSAWENLTLFDDQGNALPALGPIHTRSQPAD